jgi:hypothetical protein
MDKSPYTRNLAPIIEVGFFMSLFTMMTLAFIIMAVEYEPPLELSCEDGTVLICYSAEAGYGDGNSWACGTSRVSNKRVVLPSDISCTVRQHGR